jgi:hypothetical protein
MRAMADQETYVPVKPLWARVAIRVPAALILILVFGRSMVDGLIGTIYQNVAIPRDPEMPATVTAFRAATDMVSTLGGRGEGLNCSMPWGIDYVFRPRNGEVASQIPVRQQFRQACVFHDLCYRHGLATYGYSQDDCDELLQEQALRICWAHPRPGECQLNAKKVAAGVKLRGYGSYRNWGESTYFEFDPFPYRSEQFYCSRRSMGEIPG